MTSSLCNIQFRHADLICRDISCLPQLCVSDASPRERSSDFWMRCRATWTAWMSQPPWKWTPVQWEKRPLTRKTAAPKRPLEPSPEHIATSSPAAARGAARKGQPRCPTSPPTTTTTTTPPPSVQMLISHTLTPPRATSLVPSPPPLFAQFLPATANQHSPMWTIEATPSLLQPTTTTSSSSLTAQRIWEAAPAITTVFTVQKTPQTSHLVHGN